MSIVTKGKQAHQGQHPACHPRRARLCEARMRGFEDLRRGRLHRMQNEVDRNNITGLLRTDFLSKAFTHTHSPCSTCVAGTS